MFKLILAVYLFTSVATAQEADEPLIDEVCPTITEWQNLTRAITMEGYEVEVVQGVLGGWGVQYFYTARCDPECEGKPCKYIEKGVTTECRTRFNLVPAISYREEADELSWRMIKVPGQCACVRVDETSDKPRKNFDLRDLFLKTT